MVQERTLIGFRSQSTALIVRVFSAPDRPTIVKRHPSTRTGLTMSNKAVASPASRYPSHYFSRFPSVLTMTFQIPL
jgi:hypothetical protein